MKVDNFLSIFLDTIHDPCLFIKFDGEIEYVNNDFLLKLGYQTKQSLKGKIFIDLLENADVFDTIIQMIEKQTEIKDYSIKILSGINIFITMECSIKVINDKDGDPIGLLFQGKNTPDHNRLLEELTPLFNLADEIFCITDQNGTIKFPNLALEKILGISAKKIIGRNLFSLFYNDENPTLLSVVKIMILEEKKGGDYELKIKDKRGTTHWILLKPTFKPEENLIYFSGIEITEKKKTQETTINLATTDPLTEALNCNAFFIKAQEEFNRCYRYSRPFDLLIIHIDNLDKINEEFGFQTGNEVLKIVSNCCKKLLRNTDFWGRLYDNNFAVCLTETNQENIKIVINRIKNIISTTSYNVNDKKTEIILSFAATTLKKDDVELENVFKRAILALKDAKAKGPGNFVIN